MEVKAIEQYLFEQLEKIAPGKYTRAGVLQQFKSKLRFPCAHLKGGRNPRLISLRKDYNLSIFRFPTGVTEIKCLYNCGLKIRSDESELVDAFNEAYDLPSTNTKAAAEVMPKIDPGPAPVYSDEYRQRLKDSSERFLAAIEKGLADGRIKPDDKILGGVFPHPDPIESPESQVERELTRVHQKAKNRNRPLLKQAMVVVQDSIPEFKAKKSRRGKKK